MKSKSLDFRQIEWWIVTIAFLSILLFNLIALSNSNSWWMTHESNGLVMVLIPAILYSSFYIVHMKLMVNFLINRNTWTLIGFSFLTLLVGFGLSALVSIGSGSHVGGLFFLYLGLAFLYLSYQLAAFVLREMLTPPHLQDYFLYNLSRLILCYLFLIVFLILGQKTIVNEVILIVFILIVPILLVIVTFNYFLIYKKKKLGERKKAKWFFALLIAIILTGFLIASIADQEGFIFFLGLIISLFVAFILIPLTNLIFNKYESMTGTIFSLTSQVNQGSASLDFLRSQINPHFLFNALNTLYASALIENGEKTADGIQKLGDMMRFMIHENQQDKIPLSREINYLRNYLDLQMLRFGKESKLEVDIQISEELCQGDIAPMLLIPYVENAFKHGISLKEKSWIKLNLRCIAGSVHLDLVNSVHPEKPLENSREESGIGLDNVKKRLDLVYPNKHQLNIIKNDSDFFVHLSIQLI